MQYPTDLYTEQAYRQTVDVFRGYNHNLRIGDGEFFEMENLTSDHYPVFSPRGKRGVYTSPVKPQGLIAKDALCYVDNGAFYINRYQIPGLELGTACGACPNRQYCLRFDPAKTECFKQLISMGAWVIILPDRIRVNTLDYTWERLDVDYESTGAVTFQPCTLDGGDMDVEISDTAPKDTTKNWIDTGEDGYALKQYSSVMESWVAVATTYVKISAEKIGEKFKQYDGVTISGVTHEDMQDLNASIVIQARDTGWIVVTGLTPGLVTQEGTVTVTRKMPDMDFVVESKNRLWGCKYGMVDGVVVNEIYASKLGDPTNWNCFMGLSTDSYVVSCGTDGPWTGAASMDSPLFFKEDCLHRVYGDSMPFGVTVTACRGVQKGSEKSLAIVGETLLYKSRGGIMRYDGSLPAEVSAALGNAAYSGAVGGAVGNKYYVSMQDAENKGHLFVYDMEKGMWHREDDLRVSEFCCCDGELYAICHGTGKIITMLGSGEPDPAPVKWMAVTGELGVDDPDRKYLSRLSLRLRLPVGAKVQVSVSYDSSGVWEPVAALAGHSLRSFSLPIRPRRCDHLQLKLSGTGDVKIFSITKTVVGGSELP